MKSTFISKENNDAKFTMEFSAEEFENAIISDMMTKLREQIK